MTTFILSYKNSLFSIKTGSGAVLWSGCYLTISEAREFARGYVSSWIGAYCTEEENLEQKFYAEKEKREKAFFNGEKI